MIDMEDLLREAMIEHTQGLELPQAAARAALRSTVRARRRRVAAGALVVAGLAAAVAVATVPDLSAGSPAPAHLIAPAAPGHHGSSARLSYPRVLRVRLGRPGGRASLPPPPAHLLRVAVPEPAPGFPLQRAPATAAYTQMWHGSGWADVFLLGRARPRCEASAGGGACASAGPEAAILVTESPEPSTPNRHDTIGGNPVVSTVRIQGHRAYVTRYRPRVGPAAFEIYFAAGPFVVQVGGNGDATVRELAALADSIHGL